MDNGKGEMMWTKLDSYDNTCFSLTSDVISFMPCTVMLRQLTLTVSSSFTLLEFLHF